MVYEYRGGKSNIMSDELKLGATASDFVDEYNSLIYVINSEIKKISTADLVRVIGVNENNTIDVLPLLGSIKADGSMNGISPIYGVRYIQWQFGLNKIKAVPVIGDVGLLIACKRDISNVENGSVGSFRQFSLADGIYIGGIEGLNQPATQSIEFSENNLTITGTGTLNINAPTVNINSENATVTATASATVEAPAVSITASTSASISSPSVTLGGSGGKRIALDGDVVKSGNTTVGTIVASSEVMAI